MCVTLLIAGLNGRILFAPTEISKIFWKHKITVREIDLTCVKGHQSESYKTAKVIIEKIKRAINVPFLVEKNLTVKSFDPSLNHIDVDRLTGQNSEKSQQHHLSEKKIMSANLLTGFPRWLTGWLAWLAS